MSLLTLIQKGGLYRVATATVATTATQEAGKAGIVAIVATVAVASPQKQETPVKRDEAVVEVAVRRVENRLEAAGMSIAIDKGTGRALLIFKPSDAEIVRHVATVHRPFEVQLTESQWDELLDSQEYFERLEQQQREANR